MFPRGVVAVRGRGDAARRVARQRRAGGVAVVGGAGIFAKILNLARDGGEHPRQGRVARVQRRTHQHRDGVVRGGDDGRVRVRGASRRARGDGEDATPQRERETGAGAPRADRVRPSGAPAARASSADARERIAPTAEMAAVRAATPLDSETPSPATIFSTRSRSRQKTRAASAGGAAARRR